MKKKLVMLCLAGIMVFGITACGDKTAMVTNNSEVSTESESDTTEVQTENSVQQNETKVSEREDYISVADINIEEYFTLADYKNMTVTAEKPEITDELIENYINSELLVGEITDRAVKEGDIANIDYVGKKDGVAFEGGTASGAQLEIGSGTFIAGFEEGLVGVMPGETVDLNLTFPENYHSADLAGQKVVFTVTVNSIIGSADYATVTEEQLKSLGVEFSNKEELWETGKKELEQQADMVYELNIDNAIDEKLIADNQIENVPAHLVDEEIQTYNLYMENIAVNEYGIDLETYVTLYGNITMEQYNTQLKKMSETTVKSYLIYEAVFRAENMEITDEMIKERAQKEAPNYNMTSGEELLENVGYTPFRMYMVKEMVLDKLSTIVVVEEPSVSE